MSHDDDKPAPIWKKELSFKRKPRAEEPPAADDAPAPSVWKKEISLRRKPTAEVAATPVVPEPEAETPPEPELPVLPEPVLPVAVAPAVPPLAPVEHAWLTEPLEAMSQPPAEITAVQPEPELQPEPPLVPDPVAALEPDFFDLPELAELLPGLEPEPVEPEPLPPAAVVPAPEAATAPVPFYKRELSFGRAKEPKEPKEPKAAKPPKPAKAPKAAKPERERGEHVPFYKRELSLGRGPKAPDATPAEPKAPKEPKAKRGKAPRTPRELPKLRRAPRAKASKPGAVGAKKLVGLKIGSSQIAAARIQNGSVPELVQAVRAPLEPGVVVAGELRDPEALAVALREFFKQHGLPKRGVRLGIANNRIGVRTFDVAGITDPKQLDNAIKFRAQEVLPIPIEEAVLDYQVLSQFTDEEGQPVRRVLLVVAYRELVDRYLLACRKAGIQIVGIDLEAFALLRALAEPRPELPVGQVDERGALVAVAIGHERSTFAVSDGRICDFTRVLEWGGWALNVAIARALDTAPSEAEPIKRALSFAGAGELPEGIGEEQLETAREAARKQLQSFARELVSSLQFYQNQPGSLGIGEIVVTGGTTHMPGFGAELERLIGVPVRVGDPLSRVKVSKKVREREQLGSLAVAIGLGIED